MGLTRDGVLPMTGATVLTDDVSPELTMFLRVFLWADEPWLEVAQDSCKYWQHRLAQQIDVQDLGDGNFGWKANTLVVKDVQAARMADLLCLELNDFTAGWSFAYDPSDRSIRALCSMAAPIEWDRYLVRFAEATKLSAWFADQVAERLALEVSGKAAFSHPEQQPGQREIPDAVYSHMNVVRERPEWIFDATPFQYPPLEEVAEFFTERMGNSADAVEVKDPELWIVTLDSHGQNPSHMVHAGFLTSNVFGSCWNTDVTFPGWRPSAADVRALVWRMFENPVASLLGGWTTNDDGTARFSQVTLTGELKSLERLDSFLARDSQILWGLTSTLSEAIDAAIAHLDEVEGSPVDQDSHPAEIREAARRVLGALRAGESEILSTIPTPDSDVADRRMLWLRPVTLLMTAAWFNPMGPTLSTLEVIQDTRTGDEYLLELMRHPFRPRYRILAPLPQSQGRNDALARAVAEVIDGSIPTMVTFDGCPENLLEPIRVALKERILDLSEQVDDDLLTSARILAVTRGRPWDWASTSEETRQEALALDWDGLDPYGTWLEQATHPDHVAAILGRISEPWDGALNYQMSLGTMGSGHFDTGPLFVTYSRLGATG